MYGGDISTVWWPYKADYSATAKTFIKKYFLPGATANWKESYAKRTKYSHSVEKVKIDTNASVISFIGKNIT